MSSIAISLANLFFNQIVNTTITVLLSNKKSSSGGVGFEKQMGRFHGNTIGNLEVTSNTTIIDYSFALSEHYLSMPKVK
jgi:hypothetical protein